MIFWTWRSYFIRWQIFENKVWCPVSKKRTKYFHFLLSLAYPIDRLDWALFSVVILFHHWFPLLEKVEIWAFILPRNFPAVLSIFTGRGGEPHPPHSVGRPSLVLILHTLLNLDLVEFASWSPPYYKVCTAPNRNHLLQPTFNQTLLQIISTSIRHVL